MMQLGFDSVNAACKFVFYLTGLPHSMVMLLDVLSVHAASMK